MKHLLITLLVLVPVLGFGQTFYVDPTDSGYEKEIVEALKYNGTPTTDSMAEADYRIECKVTQSKQFYFLHRGFVRIVDKDGREVSRSKELKRGAGPINRFNPRRAIFSTIGKKYLPEMVKSLDETNVAAD